jgi:hypothetical protein
MQEWLQKKLSVISQKLLLHLKVRRSERFFQWSLMKIYQLVGLMVLQAILDVEQSFIKNFSRFAGKGEIQWWIHGTNTRGELLGLWVLLETTSLWKVVKLQVAGDSKIIIEWFNGVFKLQETTLDSWQRRIAYLRKGFLSIEARHIYRELNQEADALSKEALSLDEGVLLLSVWNGNVLLREEQKNMF